MSDQIPEGWTRTKFQDIAGLVKGLTYSTGDYASKDAGHPFITLKCIQKNGGFSPRGLKYYSGKYKESQIVKAGDVVFANTDLTRDGDVVGSPLLVPFIPSDKPALISMDLSKVVPKNHQNGDFIYFWLQMDEVKRQMINLSAGSTVLHLNTHDVPYLRLAAPPISEQKKIAAILSSVDEVIEKTRAQIDKLKDLKTGMMQELLTKGIGHTEFKDTLIGHMPMSWSFTELGKVLIGIDSGWSPSCMEVKPGTGEWGVLKVSAVTRGEFLENQSKALPRHLSPREKIKVNKGDLLLTRANGVADLVGKCVIVSREPQAKLMMSDKILRLKPTKMLFNEFLLHVFNSSSTRKQIELCWGGSSGQKNISQSDINRFLIPLPPVAEQKVIAKSITQIDYLLYDKNRKLQSLVISKKALMQDLLTGIVRVQVDTRELTDA
ncbi:MAG: restriction endonuclease subunit S [Halomonas sp.]|nr:restriction endonuclease subunit S [Halomonas sp.]MBR2514567.1 restriction endonuclease subunit S [Halomonas sp.]